MGISKPKKSPKSGAEQSEDYGSYQRNAGQKVRGMIKLLLCELFKVKPVYGGVADYLESMDSLINDAIERKIEPLVVSTFPHGDPVSNLWSRRFSAGLEKLCKEKGVVFFNAMKLLSDYPIEKVVLSDGLHITKFSHSVLAEALHNEWASILAEKGAILKR